jgi:hypothetical protein
MPLQIRRGTQAEADALMVPPQEGELVYITDSEQLYIGDGNTLLGALDPVTGYTAEDAIDDIGAALTSGVHQNITFTYTEGGAQDLANRIDATVGPNVSFTDITATGNTVLANTTINGPLTVTGKLIANFSGSIFADDSTLLVDGVDNKINLDGTVKGDIIPNISEVYDIGSPSLKFKDLYLSGTSLWLGGAQVTATGGVVNLPAGSTIGGNVILDTANEETAYIGDIQGSVFGDDSTTIVDSIDNSVTASVVTITQAQINVPGAELKINSADDIQTVPLTQYVPVPGDYNIINSVIDNSGGPSKRVNAGRGTLTAPTALQGSDSINAELFFGHDGSQYILSTGIIHAVDPAGSVSSGVVPGTVLLATYAAGDVSGENPRGIRVNRNGNVTINKALDYDTAAALDVEGDVTINGQIDLKDLTTTAGSNPGEVDLATSTVAESWLKIKVGGVEYAIPLHALNP